MFPDEPFALHLTWTCYGTWLAGDKRGYVSNTRLPGGGIRPKQNTPGTPYTADDPYTREQARAAQKNATVWLTRSHALIVANNLTATAQRRGWRVLRAAVMANHLHVVVTDCPDDGAAVRRVLKGNSDAALREQTGERRRWWTAGGSDRYKHGSEAVETAVEYVARQVGKLAEVVDMEVRLAGQEEGGAADGPPA